MVASIRLDILVNQSGDFGGPPGGLHGGGEVWFTVSDHSGCCRVEWEGKQWRPGEAEEHGRDTGLTGLLGLDCGGEGQAGVEDDCRVCGDPIGCHTYHLAGMGPGRVLLGHVIMRVQVEMSDRQLDVDLELGVWLEVALWDSSACR